MNTYVCTECWTSASLIAPVSISSLFSSSSQQDKFDKHTTASLSGPYPVNGIFDNQSCSGYQCSFANVCTSGILEIDDQGRRSLMHFSGSRVGSIYSYGEFAGSTGGVRGVRVDDSAKAHAFPIPASPSHVVMCAECGRPLHLG